MTGTPLWHPGEPPVEPPANRWLRLARGTRRQQKRSRRCPPELRLDGKLALVTGGNAGIGLATCHGLLQRGAEVGMLSRNPSKAERACQQLRQETPGGGLWSATLDLADLDSVRGAAQQLEARLDGRRADILVCNAGFWPQRHDRSPQGHELAFATNVLGHFLLLQCASGKLLSEAARIVILTGDIYVLARACTPTYAYSTPLGGMLAYCRSKLGNLWLASELQRRQPAFEVVVVHPGVVASGLGGASGARADAIRQRFMIDLERGAETSLYAAAQPGLPRGAYLHNTYGPLRLRADDDARDAAAAARLWEECDALCRQPA